MVTTLLVALAIAQQPQPTVADSGPLKIVTFTEPQGKLHIYLPSDMAAGDTISGTVVPEPTGRSQSELDRNSGVLDGLVIDIGDTKVPVKNGRFSIEVPESLELSNGRTQSLEVKPDPTPVRPWMPMFDVPPVVQVFRPIRITGPFDGESQDTKVTISGQPAPVLAETPRGAVVGSPDTPSPESTVQVQEGTQTKEFKVRIIAINLTAPSTQLVRGHSTPIKLEVMGLDGLDAPLPIRITNRTPTIIELEGGDEQTHVIKPDDVQLGGICGFQLNIMAKQAGGFSLSADAVPIADATQPPAGFKKDPDDGRVVLPDGSELGDGTKIKPRRFGKNKIDEPNTGGAGKWQERGEPYTGDLPWAKIWLQRVPSIAYPKGGHIYRGGEFIVQFKYTGTECLPGKWRQIVRSTVYVGSSTEDLKPAEIKDGRYVPSSDANHKGDWEVDTNKAGKDAKNPDYPNQDKGEMIDSPSRAAYNKAGYYSSENPRVKAKVVREVVEFYTFWIGPDGKICKIFKWSFSVTWDFGDGDPATENGMNHATVSTTFEDPVEVDKNSDEGKAAQSAYDGAMSRFMG